jgi:hypothetical protein
MDYMEISNQHEDVLKEDSNEAKDPYDFKTDYWCVFTCAKESEGRQNQRSVIMKEETTLSHEHDKDLDHFLPSDAE